MLNKLSKFKNVNSTTLRKASIWLTITKAVISLALISSTDIPEKLRELR